MLHPHTQSRNHAADAACCIRSPAEAEEIDAVARVVHMRQVGVAVLHLAEEPLAQRTAGQVFKEVAVGADAAVIKL